MNFDEESAFARAKEWSNNTGKTHIVYRDQDGFFLAAPLERYESDPPGYKHVTVLSTIQPESQNL